MEAILAWIGDVHRAAQKAYEESAGRMQSQSHDFSEILMHLAQCRGDRAAAVDRLASDAALLSYPSVPVRVDAAIVKSVATGLDRVSKAEDLRAVVAAVLAVETPLIPALEHLCRDRLGAAESENADPVAPLLAQVRMAGTDNSIQADGVSVWNESVLVVAADAAMGRLLKAVLGEVANVALVLAVSPAVAVAASGYLSAIVADADLPDANASVLYQRMEKHYPGSGARFVCYGEPGEHYRHTFLAQRAHRMLTVPFGLGEIQEVVLRMIHRSSVGKR